MTPQEEQVLVQIIVQCVRAVLETMDGQARHAASKRQLPQNLPQAPLGGSRFITVAPEQPPGPSNGHIARADGNDVRLSLQRFLRSSEPQKVSSAGEQPTFLPNDRLQSRHVLPASGAQKRQLITQANILDALQQGQKVILLRPDAIVTPLAWQVAKDKGLELRLDTL
jgi:hypothetical protein